VPLAGHERAIAGGPERFGNRGGVFGEVIIVGGAVGIGADALGVVVDHVADARLVGV